MRSLRLLMLLGLLAAAGAAGWLYVFATRPLALPEAPFEFTVRPGASVRAVSRQLAARGLFAEGESFWILARLLDKSGRIQAGTYRLERGPTPLELLEKLARGDVVMAELRFAEGSTWRQWRAQLAKEDTLRQTLAGRSDEQIAALLGLATPPEGWLFPDTYRYAPGTADADIVRRAHAAMKKRLQAAWDARDPELPLRSPYEALILASIIEKETGAEAERALVASVFANRLRRGMRLQTDPTVIYGMGERFDGNIRKRDLTTDTPWNTYTRDGLPPTPIAMPGAASLAAATRPASSDYLYFVGKGDGSGTHQFSRTLEEHNRAVARYQLKR